MTVAELIATLQAFDPSLPVEQITRDRYENDRVSALVDGAVETTDGYYEPARTMLYGTGRRVLLISHDA